MNNLSLYGRTPCTESTIKVPKGTLNSPNVSTVPTTQQTSSGAASSSGSAAASSSSATLSSSTKKQETKYSERGIPLNAKGKEISGKQLRKWQAEKDREEKERQQAKEEFEKYGHLYCELPLHRSQYPRDGQKFTPLSALNASMTGTKVAVRARLETARGTGGRGFVMLRQNMFTAQATLNEGDAVPRCMVTFATKKVPRESIVWVEGTIVKAPAPITSVSQSDVELDVTKFFIVSRAESLPVQVIDCERPAPVIEKRAVEIQEIQSRLTQAKNELKALGKSGSKEEKAAARKKVQGIERELSRKPVFVQVDQPTRLDNRVIDLRTKTNQAIFRVSSTVGHLFRSFCFEKGFIELHSPKMLGAASEGGASVFRLKYFDRPAFLAQSPQLYKQMCISADFPGVFEVGPVFRAENSNTHRHLCEFTGMDLEIPIQQHYHEVLDLFGDLFHTIFSGIEKFCQRELAIINQQYPFTPFKWPRKPLILHYRQGIEMLQASGVQIGETDDIDTTNEKKLGALVREKYDTDFYMLDKFPLSHRPFYTMPDPEDEKWSNSYDFFIRGEEILSGAQRIHCPTLLMKRAIEHGVDISTIQPYIDAFKYGAPPHGGGGIGLERVVMLYLGLNNIRKSSLFPRDPQRITP
eukprot:CAMPEP_0201552692 /NCGR_PEP_ID=MMETSP0173_2-20130828/16859_1 /ASSEMBLY_ACC=CAM_ASM_000268 /TAXON_ID=218659 /ORGANISM="Vexillifera sp., Strain DIVA3 564/2" /LENGTH=637 /DNA_ID=CAMNT_0047963209 /DNA_START=13 /DNA_END=1926 /DNA_ORIENTATION=+